MRSLLYTCHYIVFYTTLLSYYTVPHSVFKSNIRYIASGSRCYIIRPLFMCFTFLLFLPYPTHYLISATLRKLHDAGKVKRVTYVWKLVQESELSIFLRKYHNCHFICYMGKLKLFHFRRTLDVLPFQSRCNTAASAK